MSRKLLVAAALALAGCQEEGVRHYQAPHVEALSSPEVRGERPKVRLLAAILPHGEHTWFFKLSGPADAVGEQAEAFDGFVRSVRFGEDQERPVRWTVPAGWRAGRRSELRYATFRAGPKEKGLEVTVVPLGR